MHADLQGALDQINRSYKAFEHRGKKMSKEQVRRVLQYGLKRGYKTTAELTDSEVDAVLNLRNEEPKSV
jgi:ribulose bisphosphate carboxylase small subunit